MELLFYFVFQFFEYILRPYSVVVLFPPPSRVESSRGVALRAVAPPLCFEWVVNTMIYRSTLSQTQLEKLDLKSCPCVTTSCVCVSSAGNSLSSQQQSTTMTTTTLFMTQPRASPPWPKRLALHRSRGFCWSSSSSLCRFSVGAKQFSYRVVQVYCDYVYDDMSYLRRPMPPSSKLWKKRKSRRKEDPFVSIPSIDLRSIDPSLIA